jgi:DNA-binding winged helix-turn-helix (wHTH) protein
MNSSPRKDEATVPDSAPRLVRFGIFELDLETGELRRKGARVPLQEQPFQVLAELVRRPGELVTREQLRARLWPAAVFVDFDHGLNKAVGKVRDALGDLAERPRFVETLERRGYRFIAQVERARVGRPARRGRTDAGCSTPVGRPRDSAGSGIALRGP